jgi:hypothetical protein
MTANNSGRKSLTFSNLAKHALEFTSGSKGIETPLTKPPESLYSWSLYRESAEPCPHASRLPAAATKPTRYPIKESYSAALPIPGEASGILHYASLRSE